MQPDLSDARWQAGTTPSVGGQHVEIAFLDDGTVALRDSRNPDGPVLTYTALEWECFVDGVEKGEFTRF
jgi:hypothetical protein